MQNLQLHRRISVRRLHRAGATGRGTDNAGKRRIFDAIVWSLSLLFAFGLLIDSALASAQPHATANASWNAACGDVGAHAVRMPR